LFAVSVLTVAVAGVSACGHAGGVETGQSGDAKDGLVLAASSSSSPGWNATIPAFLATPQGAGLKIVPTYGGSGELSRSILDGKTADIVNFAGEPDVTRLARADMVAPDWNAGPTRGSPFGSVVTLLVRAGNPNNIHDWGDLLQPGLEVVTPNPTLSGSGKWGLVAAYTAMSNGNMDPAAGLNFLRTLILEHVKSAPSTGHEATQNFAHGTGDVLITLESNALGAERRGEPVEHITPPQTIRVDNVVAVISGGPHVDAATKLNDYLYTVEAQRLWARAGYRPVDPTVAAEFASDFPTPQKLWTIADLGGWRTIDPSFFDSENGSIMKIFKEAVR
jgi:sulfate transport system substrate-binding protein